MEARQRTQAIEHALADDYDVLLAAYEDLQRCMRETENARQQQEDRANALAERLYEARIENEALEAVIKDLERRLQEQAPKVRACEQVLAVWRDTLENAFHTGGVV